MKDWRGAVMVAKARRQALISGVLCLVLAPANVAFIFVALAHRSSLTPLVVAVSTVVALVGLVGGVVIFGIRHRLGQP